jgi:hypothetical protein
MIGPAVPVPVSAEVLDALKGVEVKSGAGQTSGFTLEFELARRSPLQTLFLLSGGASVPLIRVVLAAVVNGLPEVLMDGVMTNHEFVPGALGGPSTLRVTGEDLSRVMDYVDFSGLPYPAMPVELRVAMIVAKYAMFGIVPLVVPTLFADVPLPTDRIPRQQGKDLGYIRQLAEQVGYVFYVDPGPLPGMSVAYWGPEIRLGIPQPALNTDMDAHTNVEALNFQFNSEARTQTLVTIQEPFSKAPIPIPVPALSLLKPPLGVVQPLAKVFEPLQDTAKSSVAGALLSGMAEAGRTADVIKASGSLDVLRYGRCLRARKLVGVRGAGIAFDGVYYVTSVTHTIRRGEYKQSFELTRDAFLSTLPALPS